MNLSVQDEINAEALGPEYVTAASLGRIWQHWNNRHDQSFAIVTPYRQFPSDLPPTQKPAWEKEQERKTIEFKAILRSHDLGYIPMTGAWKGESGLDTEPSYFIPNISLETVKSLQKEFKQQAVLYCGQETGGSVHLLWEDGRVEDIGTFHPQRIGDVFSRIKGKPFTFASVSEGFMDALSRSSYRAQVKAGKALSSAEETKAKLMALGWIDPAASQSE
jgi:hypothetical protein